MEFDKSTKEYVLDRHDKEALGNPHMPDRVPKDQEGALAEAIQLSLEKLTAINTSFSPVFAERMANMSMAQRYTPILTKMTDCIIDNFRKELDQVYGS